MPIGLRFAFFRFHVRNVYFMWYYKRRNRRQAGARGTETPSWSTRGAGVKDIADLVWCVGHPIQYYRIKQFERRDEQFLRGR